MSRRARRPAKRPIRYRDIPEWEILAIAQARSVGQKHVGDNGRARRYTSRQDTDGQPVRLATPNIALAHRYPGWMIVRKMQQMMEAGLLQYSVTIDMEAYIAACKAAPDAKAAKKVDLTDFTQPYERIEHAVPTQKGLEVLREALERRMGAKLEQARREVMA